MERSSRRMLFGVANERFSCTASRQRGSVNCTASGWDKGAARYVSLELTNLRWYLWLLARVSGIFCKADTRVKIKWMWRSEAGTILRYQFYVGTLSHTGNGLEPSTSAASLVYPATFKALKITSLLGCSVYRASRMFTTLPHLCISPQNYSTGLNIASVAALPEILNSQAKSTTKTKHISVNVSLQRQAHVYSIAKSLKNTRKTMPDLKLNGRSTRAAGKSLVGVESDSVISAFGWHSSCKRTTL